MTQQNTSSLLDDIEVTLDLYGVPQSKFGAVVAGDPTLVWKLRTTGRKPRPAMIEKIYNSLDEIKAGTWLKQENPS